VRRLDRGLIRDRATGDLAAELDCLQRPVADGLELRDARDVVERDRDAARAELTHARARRVVGLVGADLGGEPGCARRHLQRSIEKTDEARIAQIGGRDVDGNLQRETVTAPHARLEKRLAHDPCGELVHEPLSLGGRQERLRRQKPLLRVLPADEGLDRAHRLPVDGEDRLVVEHEVVLGDRARELEANFAGHSSLDGSSTCAAFHKVASAGGVRPT
jgi:hypothetical protein